MLAAHRPPDDEAQRARRTLECDCHLRAQVVAVDDRRRLAITDDVGDLGCGQPRRQRHDQRARHQDAGHRLDQLDAVGEIDDDAVASFHATCLTPPASSALAS